MAMMSYILFYLDSRPHVLFQQDNLPPYTARRAKNFSKKQALMFGDATLFSGFKSHRIYVGCDVKQTIHFALYFIDSATVNPGSSNCLELLQADIDCITLLEPSCIRECSGLWI